MTEITTEDFAKVEIQIGQILAVETPENSEKLLVLKVDFGTETREVVSGIKRYYPDPESLVGKQAAFVTNLAKRTIIGRQSQAMILAGKDGDRVALLVPDSPIAPGSHVG